MHHKTTDYWALLEDIFGAMVTLGCVIGLFAMMGAVILACFGVISW